jgi:hypothetical protein
MGGLGADVFARQLDKSRKKFVRSSMESGLAIKLRQGRSDRQALGASDAIVEGRVSERLRGVVLATAA